MHLLRKNYKGVNLKGFRLSVETQAKHILKIMYLLLIIEIISGDQSDRICCIIGIVDHNYNKFMISCFNFRNNMPCFLIINRFHHLL